MTCCTKTVLAKQINGESKTCVDCGEIEDQTHLFQCNEGERVATRQEGWKKKAKRMEKHHASGELMNVLHKCKQLWEEDGEELMH